MSVQINEKLIIEELPSLPASAFQIMQLVLDPEVPLDKLTNAIKQDVGLSTKIMRMVNSPRYSFQGCMDLQKAVVVLGLNTIKNLALSLTLLDSLSGSIEYKIYKHIFDLSICNATTTQQMSYLSEHDNTDQFYFCGLVQYLGLFILAGSMQETYWDIFEESKTKGLRFTKVLEEKLHISQCDLGFQLAKKWSLPELICNSIKYQEDPHAKSIFTETTGTDIKVFETVHLSMLATEIFVSPGKSINIERFKRAYGDFYDDSPQNAEKKLMRLGKRINQALSDMSIDLPRENSYTAVLKEANKELSSINLHYEELYHELNISNDRLAKANKQLKVQNEKLSEIAAFDFLTKVHNRSKFEQELERFLSFAKRRGQELAIIVIDIDDFKFFNELHGEHVGNEFLAASAERIQECMRKDEFLARIAGDSFAIIQPSIKNQQDPSFLAERLLNKFKEPITLGSKTVEGVSISIGIANYPMAGSDVTSLMKNADIALSRTKKNGKNSFSYFTEELSLQSKRRIALEFAFNQAIVTNEFRMVYQPIIDIKHNTIFGFEALMRWKNAKLGDVSPVEFIPHAEESGRINLLGKWCIKDCFKHISNWQASGLSDYVFAINISPRQLMEQDFFEFVTSAISEFNVKANTVEVELTENEVMHNIEIGGSVLNRLVSLGIKTNIDDFGTGHSSLLRLKQIEFNALKIDRSFVNDMLHNANSAIIVKAIISMSKSLGLKTIAEGIEKPEQLIHLQNLGCDYAQGFFFSKPVEANEIPELIQKF